MARFKLWALVATTVALAGCGDDATTTESTTRAATVAPAVTSTVAETGAGPKQDEASEEKRPDDESRPNPRAEDEDSDPRDDATAKRAALRAAVGAYEDYIAAINARDGGRLCDLLPPGAERTLKPAVDGASCGARIGNSIGYEDPRGFPVWKETTLSTIDSTAIGRDLDSARLTAAIVTSFADRTEPSVESDIAYLERVGGEWRLVKPTGALYRAIGQPEIPPSVITPP